MKETSALSHRFASIERTKLHLLVHCTSVACSPPPTVVSTTQNIISKINNEQQPAVSKL